jgi:hypothetical protein
MSFTGAHHITATNPTHMKNNPFETAASQAVKCKVKALKCHRASESNGDEVYLKFENKKIWPQDPFQRMMADEQAPINLSLLSDHEGLVKLELWEKDIFKDDYLGEFYFAPVGKQGEYTCELKTKPDSLQKYSLAWEF